MALRKLNMLVENYRIDRTDAAFNDVYIELQKVRSINESLVIRSGYGDASDALEIFHKVLIRILEKQGEFGRLFHKSLKIERLYFFRKRKRETEKQRSLDSMMDDGAPTLKLLQSDYDLEDSVLRKKEADQRQLIDFLVNDPDKVDPVTTLIVTEFPKYQSIAALAKALGLHHEVVKRKLTALSRRYDANRFGDYRDYLAV